MKINEFSNNASLHDMVSPNSLIANGSHFFVSESGNNLISYYSNRGEYISSIPFTDTISDIETNGTHFFAASSSSITVYDANGNLVNEIFIPNESYSFANRIELNSSHILTSSTGFVKEINVFTIDGGYLGKFGPYDDTNGYPIDIKLNATEVLVSDFSGVEDTIKRYDHSGNLIETIKLNYTGIEIYSSHIDDKNIYIYDNNSIRKFAANGSYLSDISIKGGNIDEYTSISDMDGNSTHLFITDRRGNKILILDKNFDSNSFFGAHEGEILEQQGIISNGTHILVVDNQKYKILVYDYSWNNLDSFGYFGTENGSFSNPTGITMNTTHIFVTDSINENVQIFLLNGSFADSFGTYGIGNGEFENPTSVAVNDKNIDRSQK